MRFVSKSANLLVVLSPGLQAQPLTGTPAKPTVSVRFKDGVAEVEGEELVKMMLSHPAFNSDFISVEQSARDPYASLRQETEPAHMMTEIKYGTPGERVTKGGPVKLPPELQKVVQEAAISLAKQMLPEMIETALKGIVAEHERNKQPNLTTKPKGRPGRPPSVKNQTKEEVLQDLDTQTSSPIPEDNE